MNLIINLIIKFRKNIKIRVISKVILYKLNHN